MSDQTPCGGCQLLEALVAYYHTTVALMDTWHSSAEWSAEWDRPDCEPKSLTSLQLVLRQQERSHLLQALGKCNNNRAETARLLKISRAALYQKLEKHHIPNKLKLG